MYIGMFPFFMPGNPAWHEKGVTWAVKRHFLITSGDAVASN